MNRIESTVTASVARVTPLDISTMTVPVATPFAVVGVVGGAFLVGAAVGCAEGRCVQDNGDMSISGEASELSVADLLQERRAV